MSMRATIPPPRSSLTPREFSYELLPFAPEQSPFRIKGVAYRSTVDRHVALPGGREYVASQIRSDALRDFYWQNFLAGSWYDVFAMVLIDAAAARASGLDFATSLREGSRKQAREVLGGVYRSMVKLLSPATIAWSLPRLTATYFDFGSLETHRAGPGRVSATCRDIPEMIVGWYALCAGEFAECALEVAGARSPRIEWSEPRPDGRRAGLPLARVDFDLVWKP